MHRIREALPDDLPAIVALDRRASPVYASGASYAPLLGDAGLLLVAGPDQGSPLQAFLAFRCVLDEADVINIVVARDARRRGVAASLMEEGARILAARGIRRLQLDVRESNAAARALYRRCGFYEDGRRPGYYPASAGTSAAREAAVLMSRELEQLAGIAS